MSKTTANPAGTETRGLDPRLNAYRHDLADTRLRGQVEAGRYTAGEAMQVCAPLAQLHRAPAADAPVDTTVLFGETLVAFDTAQGWTWCQLVRDGYVGYIRKDSLHKPGPAANLMVTATGGLVFSSPDIKSPNPAWLPMGARLAANRREGAFHNLDQGGYIHACHVRALDDITGDEKGDFVSVAELLTGAPYLWGGKSIRGIDCSGLVQLAMQMAGFECPRDTYMQAAEVGCALPINPVEAGLRRGDLIFWKGHVGIMRNAETLLHATAYGMATLSEPLNQAVTRIAASGSPITAIRRPETPSSNV